MNVVLLLAAPILRERLARQHDGFEVLRFRTCFRNRLIWTQFVSRLKCARTLKALALIATLFTTALLSAARLARLGKLVLRESAPATTTATSTATTEIAP